MKSKTSVLCKAVSIASVVVMAILCIIKDGFFKQIEIVVTGLLTALLFLSLAVIIDRIEKTKVEQKRINDSIDALSEKINIMLGLDKTSVAIENLKAETPPIYADGTAPMITSEEDLTWDCPDCGYTELSANTVCTKCGYDRNKN
ncbi:MAG: hypothetical protein E7394_08900 [Ruminococcaceae bacterium]|nr:hypothetical protein [Oscillospiraceae bacterium]